MSITVQIPGILRAYCHDATAEIILSAATVRAALQQIRQTHPAIYQSVCDETGAVRRHINLFINNTYARDREGLQTKLEPGDVLTIMTAVSGG